MAGTEIPGGGGRGKIIIPDATCHHQNDSCIKMGSYESHFNALLIVRVKSQDSVHKPHLLKRRWESKRNRTEVLLLTIVPATSPTPCCYPEAADSQSSRQSSPSSTKEKPLEQTQTHTDTLNYHVSSAIAQQLCTGTWVGVTWWFWSRDLRVLASILCRALCTFWDWDLLSSLLPSKFVGRNPVAL